MLSQCSGLATAELRLIVSDGHLSLLLPTGGQWDSMGLHTAMNSTTQLLWSTENTDTVPATHEALSQQERTRDEDHLLF